MLLGSVTTPGEALYQNPDPTAATSSAPVMTAGTGCYLSSTNTIHSSLVGTVSTVSSPDGSSTTINVTSAKHEHTLSQIIEVGHIILGRVTRLTDRQATVLILKSNNSPLTTPNSGVIRTEDVTSLTTDSIDVTLAYRLGDVLLARVISLGDSRQFFLSTAEDELGVVDANCMESGRAMVPCSYKEMMCPVTKVKETRKVARPE